MSALPFSGAAKYLHFPVLRLEYEILIEGGMRLKSLNRAIDRFCARHPRFGIRRLMLYIIICNAAVTLLARMSGENMLSLIYYFYLLPDRILKGEVWRLVTFIFIPNSGNLILVAITLYFYYVIGSMLERQWGTGKFTIYYLTSMLLYIIFSFVMYFGWRLIMLNVTGYFINLSLFFAFATLFPDAGALLFFIIPVKMKWLAWLDAAYFIYYIIAWPFPNNIAPLIPVISFMLFCGADLIQGVRNIFRKVTGKKKSSPYVVYDARKHSAPTEASESKETDPFEKRCAVCGRTSASNPELEFRFCSRCAGYHCFCNDHINSHVHFTE